MYQTSQTDTENPPTVPVQFAYSTGLRELLAALVVDGRPVDINESAYAEGQRISALGDFVRMDAYAHSLEVGIHRIASAIAYLTPDDVKLRTAHALSTVLGYETGSGR